MILFTANAEGAEGVEITCLDCNVPLIDCVCGSTFLNLEPKGDEDDN